MSGYTLLYCVVNMGDSAKTLKYAKKYGAKGATISLGMGTVHNRLLDFLGIHEVQKEIVAIVLDDELAAGAIQGISKDMQFEKPHHGIAFTLSVCEVKGSDNLVDKNQIHSEAKKGVYKIIYVIVDKGKGEEVIEAANRAGARGGTIEHARGSGIHEVQKLFSVEIEPEKDKVFIIAKSDNKDKIVNSIMESMNIDAPGNGILFVQDINEVYGLHADQK